jgi:hypothetical protein
VAAPPVVVAEPPTTPASTAAAAPESLRAHTLAFNLGIGSAVGSLGLTYMWSGVNHLEVEIGFGNGYSGAQASAMVKYATGSARHRFVAGIGLGDTFSPGTFTKGNPVWLNVDIAGYEYRARSGFFLALAAGLTQGMGGGAVCPGDCENGNQYAEDVTRFTMPQGRALIGFSR